MKQKALSRIFLILSIFVSHQTLAYDFEVEGIYYLYISSDNTASVTSGDKKYTGVVDIPSTVSYNGRTMKVTKIASKAFYECKELTSLTISNEIIEIGDYAFAGCTKLTSIKFPGIVQYIGEHFLFDCSKLETVVFEDGDALKTKSWYHKSAYTHHPKYLYWGRKDYYNGVHDYSLWYRYVNQWVNSSIEVLSLGKDASIESIFDFPNLKVIYCMSEEPFGHRSSYYFNGFGGKAYANAVLYVPIGAKEKYATADVWKDFFDIREMNVADMWKGEGKPIIDDTSNQRCENPTISYNNGKVTFVCATENAIFHSTITDTDIKSYNEKEIQLGVTYIINVYASKTGYKDSEKVTATLCWLDVEPKTEGIENGIAQVSANAVLIQSHNGQITVTGTNNGTNIDVYSTSGQMVANGRTTSNKLTLSTNLRRGEVAIIKIGEKSVKVVMQ